jgi:hypothetical protein
LGFGAAWNLILSVFQRQVVTGSGYMAFGLVRDYLDKSDVKPAMEADGWEADLF